MLGSRVDRLAARFALAAGYYLFFLNAGWSIPLACAAAFACSVLTDCAAAGLPRKKKPSPARAREELLRLAGLPDDQAQRELEALVRARYPGEAFRLVPALKHPEASLSSGDVLNAWKVNRDADQLVIAATCACEPRAMVFARELRSPSVAVVDSRRLLRLIRACPDSALPSEAPRPPLWRRLRICLARVAARRARPRDALLAALLLALYLVGGSPAYLVSSLALLFHLGHSLSRHRLQRRLFG